MVRHALVVYNTVKSQPQLRFPNAHTRCNGKWVQLAPAVDVALVRFSLTPTSRLLRVRPFARLLTSPWVCSQATSTKGQLQCMPLAQLLAILPLSLPVHVWHPPWCLTSLLSPFREMASFNCGDAAFPMALPRTRREGCHSSISVIPGRLFNTHVEHQRNSPCWVWQSPVGFYFLILLVARHQSQNSLSPSRSCHWCWCTPAWTRTHLSSH